MALPDGAIGFRGTAWDILSVVLGFSGTVTAVPGANQFTIPSLAGIGAGALADVTAPFCAFVVRDAGGAGAAPQGELQAITAYVSATGVFTTNPFTAAVAAGDEIVIMHPRLALLALTGARIGYLDELAAANIPADVDTLLARLTAARAGYLDNINNAQLLNVPNLSTLTAARIGYLDELAAANIPADVDTLLARLTAARAGYLDNINQAGLLQVTAARAGYLDTLDTAETSGTFSKVNDLLEQTVFTFNPGGLRTRILGIWLDLVNLTQSATIRVKHEIDGATYRTFDSLAWTTALDDGVYITGFNVNDNVQVSIQSAVLEGAARDIPYYYIYQVVE